MIDVLLNLFLVLLVLIGLFSILIVMMQRSSTQPGMGAAMGGGGAADQAFGADSATVLTKATQTTTIVFFVLAFLLYLGFQARSGDEMGQDAPLIPDVLSIEGATTEAGDVNLEVPTDVATAGETAEEAPVETNPNP